MKFLKLLFLFILLSIFGGDEKEEKTEGSETEETVDDKDLKKAIDDEIAKMNTLIKSKSAVDFSKLAEDPKMKEQMLKALKVEDPGTEAEETGLKKSVEAAVESNEEIIDAVPVLKDFGEVLNKAVDAMDEMKTEINELKKSQTDMNELQESFAKVTKDTSELIKSFSSDVEEIGKQPQEVKGKIGQEDILKKNFDGEGEEKSIIPPIGIVRDALMKSHEAKEIDAGIISKWEMSGYDARILLEGDTIQKIAKHFPKQEVN